MDVYTEHENFAIRRVLFHYKSILLPSYTSTPLCISFLKTCTNPVLRMLSTGWDLHQQGIVSLM